MKFTGERYVPSKYGALALQHYHRYEFAINQIDLSNSLVLDIACGEGYGSALLAEKAKMVYGVDISKETIEYAKKKYTKENLFFKQGEAAKIPMDDSSVDILVSFETIEHHDKHEEMLNEIKRVLKPEGILIISSPDKGYYEKYYSGIKNEFHVKELYKEEFQALIEKHFSYLSLFMQNNMFGSIIAKESKDNSTYVKPKLIEKNTNYAGPLESRFNLIIACDSILKLKNEVSLYSYSIQKDIYFENYKYQQTLAELYNSKTWKIGSLILKPFHIIKQIIR